MISVAMQNRITKCMSYAKKCHHIGDKETEKGWLVTAIELDEEWQVQKSDIEFVEVWKKLGINYKTDDFTDYLCAYKQLVDMEPNNHLLEERYSWLKENYKRIYRPKYFYITRKEDFVDKTVYKCLFGSEKNAFIEFCLDKESPKCVVTDMFIDESLLYFDIENELIDKVKKVAKMKNCDLLIDDVRKNKKNPSFLLKENGFREKSK